MKTIQEFFHQHPLLVRYGLPGLVLGIALAIRLWRNNDQSAWIDEAYSIVLARYNLPMIVQGTAADQHPPFYYFLLHFWLGLSNSVTGARLLSVVCGVINVAQAMVLGSKLKGFTLGLLGGLLLALAPMSVWYSQETRMYILLAVLTTAATIELWICMGGGGKLHWVLYTGLSLLALYTQYFAVFVLISHAAAIMIWSIRTRRRTILFSWLISMALVGIGFLPWLPTAVDQVRNHTIGWIPPTTLVMVRDTWFRVLTGVPLSVLPNLLAWLIFAVLLALAAFLFFRRAPQPEEKWPFEFLSLQALVPLAAISGVSLIFPIFQYKQFLIVLLPLLLLAAWLLSSIPVRWMRAAALLGFAALLVGVSIVQPVMVKKDDWRGAASYLSQQILPGDRIYCNPAACSLPLSLYLPKDQAFPMDGYPPHYNILTGGWAGGRMITASIADQILGSSLLTYRRIWLVEFSPELWDPDHLLENWLGARSRLVVDQTFTRIHVRCYELNR